MATFEGFGDKALPFLKAIGFHQSRDWFQENKKLYEKELREPLVALVEDVSTRFEKAGLPFRGARKTSLYRINRDVRFSKNKDPYNTHVSALWTRTGTKKDHGFIYIRVSNESTFIAAGFYALDAELLTALRNRMVSQEPEFQEILKGVVAHGLATDEHDDALKRPPRGFSDVPESLKDLIRQRHITVSRSLNPSRATSSDLADDVLALGHRALPLCEFGWRAIDPILSERAKEAA
ncbi:MAG: TIGR02453 family protein [Pseudomonadota bacterium]